MGTLLQVIPGSRGRRDTAALWPGKPARHGAGLAPGERERPLPLPKPPPCSHFRFLHLLMGLGLSRVRRWLRRSSGTGGKLRDPRALSMGFLTATGNAVPKPELLPVPFPVPRCRTCHGCYSLTTSPSWQPIAAPSLGGAVPRGRGGTDPISGHVPAALCDLQAWRRWVPMHPPHPAGHLGASPLSLAAARQIPRGFRRNRCSEVSQKLATPGLLSGSALAGKSPRGIAVPQRASVSLACWGTPLLPAFSGRGQNT